MFKKRLLVTLSFMILIASFQSANAGLGALLTEKTNSHYGSMLNQDKGHCCDCDKKSSCKSACLGSIGCLEKNIFQEPQITSVDAHVLMHLSYKPQAHHHINPIAPLLLRPPQ